MNVFSKNLNTSCCCGMDVWWYNSRMVSRRMEPIGIYRFLIGAPFRRWIATDCDRPFFESTCFYESRNSTGIIFVFYFSNLSSFPFSFFVWRFSWGAFSKILLHWKIQPGTDVSVCFGAQLFCVFKIRYFWFPILNHTVLVSSILFSFIFNGVKIS